MSTHIFFVEGKLEVGIVLIVFIFKKSFYNLVFLGDFLEGVVKARA